MKRIIAFVWFMSLVYLVLIPTTVAGDSVSPPKCIGKVCLGDYIEKYEKEKRIEFYARHMFGPVAGFKDEGRFVSTSEKDMEKLNYAQLTSCDSVGIIKTIHRVLKPEYDLEYYSILRAYEKKFGKSIAPEWANSANQKYNEWQWKKPETSLSLSMKKDLNLIFINLRNRELGRKDSECFERKEYESKATEGLIPE